MHAAILAVGSELLGTQRLDTNSLKLTAVLERFGVTLVTKSVVGDSVDRLADELRRRAAETDLVLVTGGLGPTADDATRPAVARALDRGVEIDEGIVDALRARYREYGREMPESNRQQGEVIEGATVLENPRGTAPGQRLTNDADAEGHRATLFLFPGVPRELEGMITRHLEPWLREEAARRGLVGELERRVLKVAAVPESEVEDLISPAYAVFGRDDITVLASPGEIQIHLSARGAAGERKARLDAMEADLRERLGISLYAAGLDASLEAVVLDLLADADATLVTAESCTGGLVAERLTRVAGSSRAFLGGLVTYSNELKMELLGVPEDILIEHGAVSEPVARAMASGARARYGGDWGIGITGIAGPGGGTEEKPVGTVHLAVAGPGDGDVEHRQMRFPGDRDRIRGWTAQYLLEMLRRRLLAVAS